MQVNSPAIWLKDFPLIKDEGNKYDHGHAVIIGSELESNCSTGASKLAAYAALRSGAGLVSITCLEKTASIYTSQMMSVMTKILKKDEDFLNFIADQRVKSVLIGPGNGVSASTKNKTLQCLKLNKNMVIDADAISVFQNNPSELFSYINSDVVLTPHLGEFTRLFPLSDNHIDSALQAAKLSKATILLKGHNSIIASPSGEYVINQNAPSYLATAGSGDVLAGIITGIMAQGINSFTASCIGCYIHSKIAENLGPGLISEDLLSEISMVIKELYNIKFHVTPANQSLATQE